MKRIIALFMSDPHLSLTPPIWRSAEPDWLAAQARPFEELDGLEQRYACPVFCAGDIFDKWSVYPEIINFALEHLPVIYGIPGQHDLPNHNEDEIQKSAYWTLVQAGKVIPLHPDFLHSYQFGSNWYANGFAFGSKINPGKSSRDLRHIAIIHQYNCTKHTSYPGAPIESFVSKSRKEFEGYEIVVCGDNHQTFECRIGKTLFWNSGCFIQRHSNEADYKPRIGMLTEDGKIISHYLDTSKDKHLSIEDSEKEVSKMDITDLMEELNKLTDSKHNFTQAVERYLQQHGSTKEVKQIIAEAIGI